MELLPGTRLGHYEIIGPLGAGGMGRVFRARDVKLERVVALKVIRESDAGDPAWLARFNREAQLLAALNHPNIATVHGLDEVSGVRYLVMELVDGQPLSQRLAAGPLPLDEALSVGRQICDALEAAHERGIVHRDLKPGNVMLTPQGKVKVLDFGLAKSTDKADSATDGSAPYEAQTAEGVLIGTPAYMAPEQARGKPVDRRCDIWALGCLLYEMLSGRPAFRGTTFHDILAEVIEGTPAWAALPAGLPPRVAELLRRCLQKDPQKRLRDAGDLRLEFEAALNELSHTPPAPAAQVPPVSKRPRPSFSRWVWVALATTTAVVAFVLGKVIHPPAPAPTSAASWSGEILLRGAIPGFVPRVSPDGKWLAFIVARQDQGQVAVMKLDSGEWWDLTSAQDRGCVNSLCWSRDSTQLFYGRFIDVPVGVFSASPFDPDPEGAREVLVVKDAENPEVAADGSLIVSKLEPDGNYRLHRYSPGQPLRAVGPRIVFDRGWGAPLRALHTRNEVIFCGSVPDSKFPNARQIYLLNLDTGEYRALLEKPVGIDFVPLAVSRHDDAFYAVLAAGDAHHVTRISFSGNLPAQCLLTLTQGSFCLDVDAEGRLYLDQAQRPFEVLRIEPPRPGQPQAADGLPVERLAGPFLWRLTSVAAYPLELPGGGLLLATKVAGHDRLVIAFPGRRGIPLLHDRNEETTLPAVLLGPNRLVFTAGTGDRRRLCVATVEGRGATLEPIDLRVDSRGLDALAGDPDGKMLYYVQSRQVYEVPADGSRPPQKVAAGDGVAVYPSTGDLLIQRYLGDGVHLFHRPRAGGPEEEVKIEPGPLRLVPVTLAAGAIDRAGRVLVTTTTADKALWSAGLLSPKGKLELLPVKFSGDVYPAGWYKDGKILGMGYSYYGEIWRFAATENGPPAGPR